MNNPNQVLAEIRAILNRATKVVDGWSSGNTMIDDDQEYLAYLVESPFIHTLVFLESIKLIEILQAVKDLNELAKVDYARVIPSRAAGDLFPQWSEKLRHHIDALDSSFGDSGTESVTKDVTDIVRATEYAITDRRCFPELPKTEQQVHERIEAVLRCVFPDLIHKPAITKPIKNFEPDTGLPTQQMLIEYKFISSVEDAKKISDEILADLGGYAADQWKRFLYVIYETQRICPEKQWDNHLRKCGAGNSTSIIVIRGEKPNATKRKAQKPLKTLPL